MLSWVSGAGVGLFGETVGNALRATASKFPDRIAVNSFHQQQKLTYTELL
jgi:hypothetical protein